MLRPILALLDESSPDLKGRLFAICTLLAAINLGAWLWALAAFHDEPALLGVCLLVYGLGLRHAVDADHIAVIDNVTRKLMQMRQQPVSAGFFFALGHSTMVIVVAALVAAVANALSEFESIKGIGGIIGTSVSSLFLFVIAVVNIAIFVSIYRTYRHVCAGRAYVEQDMDLLLNGRGFLSRIVRPLFKLVTRSWHMFFLGLLFGLGFDTATEVAMFGVSAAQAAKDIPIGAIIALPMLFAAAMSLVDTTNGVMMLATYSWAFVKPMRKLFYNMSITLVSIVVALFIGSTETLGLVADQLQLKGRFWNGVGALNDDFQNLGFAIIGLFVAAWALSFIIYKAKGLDDIELAASS